MRNNGYYFIVPEREHVLCLGMYMWDETWTLLAGNTRLEWVLVSTSAPSTLSSFTPPTSSSPPATTYITTYLSDVITVPVLSLEELRRILAHEDFWRLGEEARKMVQEMAAWLARLEVGRGFFVSTWDGSLNVWTKAWFRYEERLRVGEDYDVDAWKGWKMSNIKWGGDI